MTAPDKEREMSERDVEGLVGQVHDALGQAKARVEALAAARDRLRAEVARLREALRDAAAVIADARLAFDRNDGRWQRCMDEAARFRALAGREPTEGSESDG
jgi:hypothetical protein